MNGRARVNLYLFVPHREWVGAFGAFGVVARDFQRAEQLAIAEAERIGCPGHSFTILQEPVGRPEAANGHWVEVERYRDIDDEERVVFSQYGSVALIVEEAGIPLHG